MAADESLPGISIPITSDWSDLDKSMDAAIADATSKSQAIASAINSGLSGIQPLDLSGVIEAINGTTTAVQQISGQLDTLKKDLKDADDSAKQSQASIESLANAFTQLAAAFAFTEGLREFGMAALEAADHVDDATQAMARLGGGAEAAQATVVHLREIASDEALSFPQLLVASQRMTAFLGDATKVPAVMEAAGNSAAVMGTNIETASKAIEKFAAGGDLSAKSLKALGLTMGDMATALGTTEANAKAAFAALDQSGKIDAVVTALGKFNGAAKEMNNDALGALVRLGQQWSEVLEEIGKALDPVIKQLVDFASANIVQPIKSMVEAFNALPAPVKDFAIGIGLAAAAIVPIAGAIAGILAVIGPLGTAFAGVATAIGGMAEVIGGALAVSLSEVLIPIAAVGAAVALLKFTGLGDDIMAFLQGPLEALKEAFNVATEVIGKEFSELGANLKDTLESLSGLLKDVGGLVEDLVKTALGPLVDSLKDLATQLGITTPSITSFKDAVKLALEFTAPVEALKLLNAELSSLKTIFDTVRPILQLFSNDLGISKDAIKSATDAMKLQGDMAGQNARLMADAAMGLNTVTTAANAYATGLKTIQEQQEKLNAAVTNAKGVLDAAKEAYDGTVKSQQVLNAAQADYEKAVKSATGATDAHKTAVDKVSSSFKDYDGALKDFHDISASVTTDEQAQSDLMAGLSARVTEAAASLDHAKQNLGFWVDELNQANPGTDRYNTALQQVSKWAAEVEKTQKAANAAIDDFNSKADVAGTKARAFADNIKAAADQAKTVEDNLRNLGVVVDQIPPKMSPLNQAMIDAGVNAGKAKNAFEDLHTPLTQIITDMGNLIRAAQDSGDWAPVLGAIDNFDKRIQNLAKTDLPEAVRQMQAYVTGLQNMGAPTDIVQGQLEGLEKLVEKMGKEGYPGAKQALDNYIESLKKVPSAIQDIQAAQEQQLAKDQAILDLMVKRGDAYGYILDQQAKLLQEEIAYAEKTGQDASDIVLGLEKVRIKQEELKTSTHGLADEYVHMIDDVLKGFDQMGGVMADAIVNGKNLGDALIGQFKKIGQSILTDVLNAALLPLKQELLGLIDSLLPGLQGGLKATSGGISGLASASTAAAGAQTALTGATIPATAAVTSLAISAQLASISMFTMIGAIAGIVGAVAGIVGDVYLAAIDTKMFHVETSLLEIRNTLINTEQDAWSQFGQMYLRLGECLNDLNSISDTVKQLKLSGGQFPEQAITDLNDIAAAARQSFAILPTILGALSTIAQDIVTWDGYIMSDLDVMVQKLGYIVTNGLAANNAIEGLASAGDMQAAASSISDSIDSAASQSSDDSASVVDSLTDVSESVSGAVDDASSAISSQVGDSSDSVVSAVNDAGDAIDALTTQVESYSTNVAGALAIADSAGKGIIAAVNTGRDATTTALEKQLAEAQKIAESGGSTVAHMVALQSEINAYQQLIAKAITDGDQRLADGYKQAMSAAQASLDQMVRGSALEQEHIDALKAEVKLDTELMNRAIADGDKTMAETYRQAAANANAELLPLLSDTAIYTRDAAAADGQLASTLPTAIQGVGYAATGAGALVAMHVDAAAAAISSAVAAAKPASFTPTGGTTTNYGPGGSTQNAPVYTNPGIPVGTQPGFGPTGPPPNPYAGGAAPSAPAGLPPGTFSKPIKTEGTITPDTTSQQGETIPGYQIPKFAKGGTVDVSGIGIVEKGEYVLDPQQWSTLFGAVEAANSGQTSTANAPTGPDYAALLKQAEQSDALLIKLEEGVRGVMAQIAIQHDQGAPPAMMELLRQQLLTAQAVTTGVPVVQNPNQGLPATVPAPIPPDLLNLKGGPTLPNAPAAAPPSAIPGPIQSAIDSLNTTLQAEKAKAVADAAHVIETQKLLADMLAPFAGKSIPGYLQSAVDTLQASVHQQEVQAKADLDSVVATQKLIAGMLAPYAPKPSGSTTDPTTTTAPTATTFAAFAPQALAYLLNIDQTLHGMSVAIPTFLAAAAPTTTPSIPPDLLGLKGGPATPNVPAPAQQAIPAVLQSAIDALEKSKDQEAMAKTADSLKLSETQALIADILAPYKGGEVPAFIRPTLDALKKTVEQQEAKIVADRDAVDATQAQIEKMLAPWQAAAPGTGTGVATPNNPNQGLPTSLPSGPDAATLQQQIIQMQGRIADAIESHSPQQVIDALKVMLASMQQQLADATRTASVAPAAPIVSNPLGNMDQRTIGFYAGALAELEDIRTTIHSERDVVTSMRDSFIVLGKNLGALLTPNAAALPSFDTGGPVPYDMTADLHAGEYVLPADITTMMRQMMRTPSYPTARQPNYDGASMPTQAVYITAPVTVITRGDPRQAAIEFTAHMKKMVPDGKAFSS